MVPVLAWVHLRFDLSSLGIRSRGGGDLVTILLLGGLVLVPPLVGGGLRFTAGTAALEAGIERLFGNPASTVENLFYFGFLAERLSFRAGPWLTPPIVGAMYTLHEAANPEYWYEGVNFALVFAAVTLSAAAYLWRRSVVVIWLGSGLARALAAAT